MASPLLQMLKSATDAFQRRSFADVERICQDVLNRFGEEANALLMLGLVRAARGDVAQAVHYLERARHKNPGHIHVLSNLGSIYRQLGRVHDAKKVLEEAVRIDPRFGPAFNNLGNVFLDLEQRGEALRCYERAVAIDARHADALANLGRLAEEAHQLERAADFAKRAMEVAPEHLQARLTLARVFQRQGNAALAVPALEALLSLQTLPPNLRISAHGFLGESFDSIKRFGEAFAQFDAANSLQANMLSEGYGDIGFLSPRRVEQLTAFVDGEDLSHWRPAPSVEQSPVFLVGFPRSGTTLLDQILSSHPQVIVQEEQDALVDVCSALMPGGGSFGFWADLPQHQIERMRGLYWARARAGLPDLSGRVFIDKLPLNIILLAVIFRLFPQAKVVIALRDPRDAVLSCFQQRFGMNAAMSQMLRLGSAAAYYDKVMRLWALYERKLPLAFHKVRYEDVVTHFDGEIANLLSFLGLAWDERVRGYADTARARQVNTPSAAQVVKPLYTSSMHKWRNYSVHMAEILPVLEPWVAAFGYEPSLPLGMSGQEL